MNRVSVRLFFLSLMFILIATITNIYASENTVLPSLDVSENFVTLTYKTTGYNKYTYSARDVVSCSSSNTNYVQCRVDNDKKRVILTPIKKTDKDVTITLSAGKKTKLVKNNANIEYIGEDKILLEELKNPVVEVQSTDIEIPNTGSNTTILAVVGGLLLIVGGGYAIYRRYNMQ